MVTCVHVTVEVGKGTQVAKAEGARLRVVGVSDGRLVSKAGLRPHGGVLVLVSSKIHNGKLDINQHTIKQVFFTTPSPRPGNWCCYGWVTDKPYWAIVALISLEGFC